ncbi:MAG: aminopeptidase P family protein [Muribaculaceae bacterium]|nr:aminopeptidase P family protein [Muribaculaceae bacterium]
MHTLISQRIAALRRHMSLIGINATIIPHADPHQSEYMSPHWHVRHFFSGFSGSAGTLVVTDKEALLWTDSRYFLQATQQLAGTEIKLMKEGIAETPTINQFLSATLKCGSKIGFDGILFSQSTTDELIATFSPLGISIVDDFAPINDIWHDRPDLPDDKAYIHSLEYAGESSQDKIATTLATLTECGASAIFISALDEIAWLLNIRGSDVKYNPVVTSFLFLSNSKSTLFIDKKKVTDEVKIYLDSLNINTAPYDSVAEYLSHLSTDIKVLVNPAITSSYFGRIIGKRAIWASSPISLPKALRNDTQINAIRSVMQRDGAALVKAFKEIEKRISQNITTTEIDIATILRHHRSYDPLFKDESFSTIAGYAEHGAIVHYEADEESNSTIEAKGLLLIDSGAQYLDGTTDITRTIALGTPTEQERYDFTLVLKGHIALASAVFPLGTRGAQLDVLARHFLWEKGLTYLHGTGHGVGHFLNVHEGPHSIRLQENPIVLQAGMVTSNEPGLYRAGVHGIRCENLILTVPAFTTEFGEFLKFETITQFPFDTALMQIDLMTDQEIAWVNEYHAGVYASLSQLLDDDCRRWLESKTAPITR